MRLIERLREQGALAYRIYDEVENGMIARRIENALKRSGFPDKITFREKVSLYKKIDLEWFERNYGLDGVFRENLEKVDLLIGKEILRNPRAIPMGYIGEIGQVLIFKEHIINFKSLVGRKIVRGKGLLSFFKGT